MQGTMIRLDASLFLSPTATMAAMYLQPGSLIAENYPPTHRRHKTHVAVKDRYNYGGHVFGLSGELGLGVWEDAKEG